MSGSLSAVHLLRHGEVYNPDKILYGRLPGFRLSVAGQQMAVNAADFLAGRNVTYLVSSPLQRAQETARPLAERFGLPIATDDRLTEAANVFEGHRVTGPGGVLKKPSSWPYYRNPLRPSWGEPYEQVAKRMLAAALHARDEVQRAIATNRAAFDGAAFDGAAFDGAAFDGAAGGLGAAAVCVSHQLPIVCLRRYVEHRRLWHDPRKRECSLGSITTLLFDGDEVVGVEYAEPSGVTPNAIDKQQTGA